MCIPKGDNDEQIQYICHLCTIFLKPETMLQEFNK